MGFDSFTVTLTTNAPVYFSGQQIQGFVGAIVSSEVSCRDINVVMCGKGQVKWTESRNKTTYTYKNNEEYGVQSLVLWTGSATDNKLQPGNHKFPFMFVLPYNIPSSFETKNGSVHYEVKASADRPWSFDENDTVLFNVHNMYDLNQVQSNRHPLRLEGEVDVGCCCPQGPVTFQMLTDRTGYVPGEKIIINGRIANTTLSTVKYTEAKIIQKLTLHAAYKTKVEALTVQRVYRPSIKADREDVWSAVPLTVPAITPSSLQHCNIIDIAYELKFIAKTGGCRPPSVSCPIIIGSVPLRSDVPASSPVYGAAIESRLLQQNMVPLPSMTPSAPTAPYNEYNDAPPPYSEPDPPTYEAYRVSAGLYAAPVAVGESDDEGGFASRPEKTGYSKL